MDSIYAGFENGAWLQVRRISDLTEEQRQRLRAPANADIAVNLIRPTAAGDLPMRRLFQDKEGNDIDEIDLWKYGYDPRKRSWYSATMQVDRPYVSEPYLSFNIGAPVITVSAPLRGKVPGVLGADLKLDTFSDFVQAQRPGQHGTVMIFDESGSIIAHPDFAAFVVSAMTHPALSPLPSVNEINSGMMGSVLRRSYNRDNNEGSIQDETGHGYLFRLTKFALGDRYHGSMLLDVRQPDVPVHPARYGTGAPITDAG
jgi:adenylate cyclase